MKAAARVYSFLVVLEPTVYSLPVQFAFIRCRVPSAEAHPKIVFECLDLQRYGRLRKEEMVGRLVKVQVFSDRTKHLEAKILELCHSIIIHGSAGLSEDMFGRGCRFEPGSSRFSPTRIRAPGCDDDSTYELQENSRTVGRSWG